MDDILDVSPATRLAADIVIAYLGTRTVEPEQLAQLVVSVRRALSSDLDDERALLKPAARASGKAVAGADHGGEGAGPLVPAVSIEESIQPNYLISLEDGKPYRTLRRHLMLAHGLTPEQYRRKWGLPIDYPMVAPSYSQARSDVAKRSGLGHAPAQKSAGTRSARAK